MFYEIIIADKDRKHILFLIEVFESIGISIYGIDNISDFIEYISKNIPKIIVINEDWLDRLKTHIVTISKINPNITIFLIQEGQNSPTSKYKRFIPPLFIEDIREIILPLGKNYSEMIKNLQNSYQFALHWLKTFFESFINEDFLKRHSIVFIIFPDCDTAKRELPSIKAKLKGVKSTHLYNTIMSIYPKSDIGTLRDSLLKLKNLKFKIIEDLSSIANLQKEIKDILDAKIFE